MGNTCSSSGGGGGGNSGRHVFYQDADGDGFGDPAVWVIAKSDNRPAGYVRDKTDCDDTTATGASCHTGCTTYYEDLDQDGFGDPTTPRDACVMPAGFILDNTDCDPGNPLLWANCPGLLNAMKIPKYMTPLVIPPAMPYVSKTPTLTYYEIAARQFRQQVLPRCYPKTTVWGYGNPHDPATFNYPAFTVEARANELVRVRWMNELVDHDGNYLPHLLPVDQTIHWANPPGPPDSMGMDPNPYTGPVPIVTHVHGAHVQSVSDGLPDHWWLPDAKDIPISYYTQGTQYGTVAAAPPGSAIFEYPNDQRASTLWYHDHALGLTRLNVYAGLAGFWLLRDNVEDALNLPGPSPKLGDAPGTKYYEIPLAIQDRSFLPDGSLFFPASRAYFDGYTGPYAPATPVPPIWNPEFFGDAMLVNGNTWPYLNVEPKLYRFRLLDGCNARTLMLQFDQPLSFTVIGKEALLPDHPVAVNMVRIAPGERTDVIVDFSLFPVGTVITLLNVGPDMPWQGPDNPWAPAFPETTGQVMQFRVVASDGAQSGQIPSTLPSMTPLTTALPERQLTLNEIDWGSTPMPTKAMLGTADFGPLTWDDPTTETPALNSTEIWTFYNLTPDAHPMHLHLVQFQVIERRTFNATGYGAAQQAWLAGGKIGPMPNPATYTGPPIPPGLTERGWTDTIVVYPNYCTKIIARFDIAGIYVWHCHIVDHEDNEMMRRFEVGGIRGNPDLPTPPPLTMNMATIPKYREPLLIPPAMPWVTKTPSLTTYHIAVRQLVQQALPTGFPLTTVWGYGDAAHPGAIFNWPALTVEARSNEHVQVQWDNQLVDGAGHYLPHLLPVDQTLHWANPAGPRDSHGTSLLSYTGPVPIVTHVHGAHVLPGSDGFPQAWWLPNASNIPPGYIAHGTNYATDIATTPGSAVFDYDNSQPAGTIWYHDHALGLTRTNVYAGLAGFWLIRDAVEDGLNLPGPSPKVGDPAGMDYYEIPMAIQDRSFKPDGNLFFPDSRSYFDGYAGPFTPATPVAPIWNPEFFGESMTVNGKTWPYLEVEPKIYRFRLLDGCNARSLILKFDHPAILFQQIGKDGAFLPDFPEVTDQVILGPGERQDVLVDFSALPVGTQVLLLNLGPDYPFQGINSGNLWPPANPATTGQVMLFKVVASKGPQLETVPLILPPMTPLTTALPVRNLTMNEMAFMPLDIPVMAMLGTAATGAQMWSDPITEKPKLNTVEQWNFFNLTMDAHPMHLHQVQFQVVERRFFDNVTYQAAQDAWIAGGKVGPMPDPNAYTIGPAIPPNPWEKGWNDTVLSDPGMVTKVITRFDILGLYVWHCHIIDHEDNERMRPFQVVP